MINIDTIPYYRFYIICKILKREAEYNKFGPTYGFIVAQQVYECPYLDEDLLSLQQHSKTAALYRKLDCIFHDKESRLALTDDEITIILCSLVGDRLYMLHKIRNLQNADGDEMQWIFDVVKIALVLISRKPKFKKFEKLLK